MPIDPSSGLSGALGAFQGVRPAQGGGDSGSLSGAASDLSQAARGLQSVQGQIAGQTMAISQMAMITQQQTQQLSMITSQLTVSINQLVSALNMSTGAQRMSNMATSMPAMGAGMGAGMGSTFSGPVFGGIGRSMIGAGGAIGGALGTGAMMAGGAVMAGLRGIGGAMGGLAAPFMPGSYSPPIPGQMSGSIGNAGFARSAMMGMGMVDMPRAMQMQSNSAEVQRLSADRAGFKMGEIMIGAGGGLLGFGANRIGDMIGSGIGASLGGRLGGLGAMAGGFAGGVIGGGVIGSALMAPVNQTIDQIGQIRGSGEMYGRNAFRFSGPGGDRPSSRERARFGRDMLSAGNEDMLFTNRDMQEVFGGAVSNDLLGGVSSSQQVRTRMRELKETVKIVGQTLNASISDSMSLLGDLKGMGIGPGQATRFLGGLNVSGLTRQEAAQGQMSFMSRFAGTGMQGSGLMSLASQSQQIGQIAMRNGSLSAEDIAANGGRSGVQQVYGQGMANMMQGSLGTLNMAARMGSGRFGAVSGNALGALGQAGAAASSSNLIGFAANRQLNMRDMLNDPASQGRILQQVGSIADQFKGLGKREDIMNLILKSQGVEDPHVFLAMMKAQPQALREQLQVQQRSLAELQVAQATENFSITGRIGRAAQNVTAPIAGGISSYVAGVQDTATNMITDARNAVLGIQQAPMSSGDVSVENLRKLKNDTMPESRRKVMNAKPSEEQRKRARDRARIAASRVTEMGIGSYISDFRTTTDPEERATIAKKILARFSSGQAFKSPEDQKAYEQAISEQFGIDLASAMNGSFGGLSKTDRASLNDATKDVRDALGGNNGQAMLTAGGGLAGSLLAPMTGGLSILAGGAAGFFGSQGRGVSQEQVLRLSQSKSVKEYLSAVAEGRDSSSAHAAMLDELKDDTLVNLVAKSGMTKKEAASMRDRLGTVSRLGGQQGLSVAMARGGNVAAEALREAGGAIGGRFGSASDIASSLAGGTPAGVQAAMRQLREMKDEDRIQLLSKSGVVGDVLARASDIHAGMTLDALKQAGIDPELAKSVLGNSKTISQDQVEELQTLMVGKLGSGEGIGMAGARGGFTQAQTAEQVKLSEQIMRTAALLDSVSRSLADSGLLKPPKPR